MNIASPLLPIVGERAGMRRPQLPLQPIEAWIRFKCFGRPSPKVERISYGTCFRNLPEVECNMPGN